MEKKIKLTEKELCDLLSLTVMSICDKKLPKDFNLWQAACRVTNGNITENILDHIEELNHLNK